MSERRDSRSKARSGMSPSCSERWTVFVWDDIHTALFPPRTEVRMCTDPKIAKRCFRRLPIAGTPIECGEGFQISGCWWVIMGRPEVISSPNRVRTDKCACVCRLTFTCPICVGAQRISRFWTNGWPLGSDCGPQPDMGNGWVGCDDGIGHAVERVFSKGRSLALLSELRQEKSAELLLNYRLQMRASGCN
jgi:hypothetical protein